MLTCLHCDELAINALFDAADVEKLRPFCCFGCQTVYSVLHQKGLEAYYDIKQQSSMYKRRAPVDINSAKYLYLDDSDFLNEYSFKNSFGEITMEFYLEGIHCLACLWLIEKLPEFLPHVLTSKLDLDRSVATVLIKKEGKFSEVAREFNILGYRPHPLKNSQDSIQLKKKEDRSSLIRIGLAGAAAGNIMIYAVSLYGGADEGFAQLFNLLTVLFALPVLSYCALPFYKNAWNAIKNKTLSIDIPISIALITGAIMGIYNLSQGIPENYFDSLTTLVFLLLLSRYFLQKIQEKGLSAQDLHFFYQSESVLKEDPSDSSNFFEIHPKFIKVNDVLKIRPGEFIPADGTILRGTSFLNNSLLTGESMPVKVKAGDRVFSGTQNQNEELLMRAEKIQADTRIGSLLRNVENGWAHRAKIVDLTSRVSKYFTFVVFILALVLFVYLLLQGDAKLAFERAITLLIVTCPCALALATPLTFTRALSLASKQGIIIKSDEVIERLSKVRNIFLDKTGTITHGKLQVREFFVLKQSHISIEEIIFNLEAQSRHPVAFALMDFVKGKQIRQSSVLDFQEILGVGVSGIIENHFYEIKREGIFQDHELIATFCLEDLVRGDSQQAVESLLEHHLNVQILSGDSKEVVTKIAKEIKLPPSKALSQLTPEDKSRLIVSTPYSMMVGDGANDAVALAQADVGVAVLGAMDISLRAADVYMTTPGLMSVANLMTLSEETMKVVYRNLVLSLIYNSLSVAAAFLGIISPLVAAIIMPLSSLTVLISTYLGTKKMRNLWKS